MSVTLDRPVQMYRASYGRLWVCAAEDIHRESFAWCWLDRLTPVPEPPPPRPSPTLSISTRPTLAPHLVPVRPMPPPPPREPPRHITYGDGQYGQVRVPRTLQLDSSFPSACNHAAFDWTGLPFLTPHAYGLQLHDHNFIEMHLNKLASLISVFNLDGRLSSAALTRLHDQIMRTAPQMKWAQMACHRSKYKAFLVTCPYCQRMAWAASKRTSTVGWVDHQVASLLAWFRQDIPSELTRPLEDTVPMV
jgi:hypothetical protein